VLFQAQNKDREVTVEVLRDHLVARHGVQGELIFADTERSFEHHEWSLRNHSHQLSEQEFSIQQVADTFEIDLDGDKLSVALTDPSEQLTLDIDVEGWTEQGLVQWLDSKTRDRFIGQGEVIEWLAAVVHHLIHNRGIPLSSLMRCQFVLTLCLQKKLAGIYAAEQKKVCQKSLFDGPAQPTVSFDNGFRFFDGRGEDGGMTKSSNAP
jgi:type III restriction enzyme